MLKVAKGIFVKESGSLGTSRLLRLPEALMQQKGNAAASRAVVRGPEAALGFMTDLAQSARIPVSTAERANMLSATRGAVLPRMVRKMQLSARTPVQYGGLRTGGQLGELANPSGDLSAFNEGAIQRA